MCYYVYILYSRDHDKYYIGQCANISDRVKRHNAGMEHSTKPYVPWQLIWSCEKKTRGEAMMLEKKLKNLSKQRIQKFIRKYS